MYNRSCHIRKRKKNVAFSLQETDKTRHKSQSVKRVEVAVRTRPRHSPRGPRFTRPRLHFDAFFFGLPIVYYTEVFAFLADPIVRAAFDNNIRNNRLRYRNTDDPQSKSSLWEHSIIYDRAYRSLPDSTIDHR